MLKAQHIPLSVGIGLNIAAQGTYFPFQKQALMRAFSYGTSEVTPYTSKQGRFEYQSILFKKIIIISLRPVKILGIQSTSS